MTDFLTTRELASILRVKERKVYDLVATGALPVRRVTGKLLFPRDEIEVWLGAQSRSSGRERRAPTARRRSSAARRSSSPADTIRCSSGRCANRVLESPRSSTAPSTG